MKTWKCSACDSEQILLEDSNRCCFCGYIPHKDEKLKIKQKKKKKTKPPKNSLPVYEVKMKCRNCIRSEILLGIPKGISIEEFADKQPCPNCGCVALEKL